MKPTKICSLVEYGSIISEVLGDPGAVDTDQMKFLKLMTRMSLNRSFSLFVKIYIINEYG